MEGPSSSTQPTTAASDDDESVLANSEYLTHQELLKRRARRLRRLSKCYRDHYWTLMEALRQKHREYYWIYGKSPYREEGEDEVRENGVVVNNLSGSTKNGKKLGVHNGSYGLCSVPNCNAKAMALSRYCFEHILLDSKQVLYKGCIFPHKRSDEHGVGPILCNKPLLKFTTPPLCARHSQDARKHISQALRKGGVSVGLSAKLSSKFHFHLVIKEYVNLIQSRRRAIASRNVDIIAVDNNVS